MAVDQVELTVPQQPDQSDDGAKVIDGRRPGSQSGLAVDRDAVLLEVVYEPRIGGRRHRALGGSSTGEELDDSGRPAPLLRGDDEQDRRSRQLGLAISVGIIWWAIHRWNYRT